MMHLWTSARLYELAKLAAHESSQSLSAFVRTAVWERVRGILPEQTIERYDRRS